MSEKTNRELNVYSPTVKGLGDGWSRFDQSQFSESEYKKILMNTFQCFHGKICLKLPKGLMWGAEVGVGQNWWL